MSISSISSVAQNYLTLTQPAGVNTNAQSNNFQQALGSVSGTSQSGSAAQTGSTAQTASTQGAAKPHHGHHHGGGGGGANSSSSSSQSSTLLSTLSSLANPSIDITV